MKLPLQVQKGFYELRIAKLTGWSREDIRSLTYIEVNRIFAIEEGIAKARK